MPDGLPWRPPTVEIDPFEKAVADAARRAILPVPEIGVPGPDHTGITDIVLADGRLLRLVLEAHAVGAGTRGGRAVLEYRISGQGRLDDRAFFVSGRAVLDHATQAFLEVDVDCAGGQG